MNKADIVLDNIKTRRSVRKYSELQISDDDMRTIIEAGRWAPSGANAQPWQFIIVRDKTVIKSIGEACYYSVFKSRHVGEASALIVIVADPESKSATYLQDSTIAGTNMTLMAHALAIGSCWIGAFEDETIHHILSIPDRLTIAALISFGYAASEPHVTPRLEQEDIVHLNAYSGSKPVAPFRRAVRSGPLSVIRQIIRVLLNRRR